MLCAQQDLLISTLLAAAPTTGKTERGTLYEAEDWTEIEAYLFGSASQSMPGNVQVRAIATSCLVILPPGHIISLHIWPAPEEHLMQSKISGSTRSLASVMPLETRRRADGTTPQECKPVHCTFAL